MEEIINAINRASYLQRCVNSPLPKVREMFSEAFEEFSDGILDHLMLKHNGCVDKWFADLDSINQDVFLTSHVFDPLK